MRMRSRLVLVVTTVIAVALLLLLAYTGAIPAWTDAPPRAERRSGAAPVGTELAERDRPASAGSATRFSQFSLALRSESSGLPLPEVEVWESGAEPGAAQRSGTSNADGVVFLARDAAADGSATRVYWYRHPRVGEGVLEVAAEVFAGAAAGDARTTTYFLPEIGTLDLRVQQPLHGMRSLHARGLDRGWGERFDRRVRPRIATAAAVDPSGSATLSLPYGLWRLEPEEEFLAVTPATVRVDRPHREIVLTVGANEFDAISGTVVDEQGAPVADVSISLTPRGPSISRSGRGGEFVVARKECPGFPLPTLCFTSEQGGFEPVLGLGPFEWGSAGNLVRVRRRGQVSLRVVDDLGRAVDDWVANVHVADNVGGKIPPTAIAPIDAGLGHLPLTTTERDWLVVERRAATRVVRVGELAAKVGPGTDVIRELVWAADGLRRITVLGPDREPLVGVVVRLVASDRTGPAAQVGEVIAGGWRPGVVWFGPPQLLELQRMSTGSDGSVRFRSENGGALFARIDPPAGLLSKTVALESQEQVVILERAGSLWGTLAGTLELADSRQPGLLVATRIDAPPSRRHEAKLTGSEYRLENLPVGTYALTLALRSPGRQWTWDLGEVAVAGATRRDVDLGACQRTPVRIHVEDLGDRPDARLSVFNVRDRAEYREPAVIHQWVRPGSVVEVALAPGSYEVGIAFDDAARRERIVKADGRFVCGEGMPVEWHCSFRAEGGVLQVRDRSGMPLTDAWFVVDSPSRYVVRSNARGDLRFETWPGQTFRLQRQRMGALGPDNPSGWVNVGPPMEIERGQATAVFPDD